MSDAEANERPRYSGLPLPPYSYVPGHVPHPVSDPRGHMHGHTPAVPAALDSERWQASEPYRFGVDLFNHGFYWEAHEAWESLWHAEGRTGPTAIWLKALIKLAAAAVKVREGNPIGATRHARRSQALLDELIAALKHDPPPANYCGINLEALRHVAHSINDLATNAQVTEANPHRLLDAHLPLASSLR